MDLFLQFSFIISYFYRVLYSYKIVAPDITNSIIKERITFYATKRRLLWRGFQKIITYYIIYDLRPRIMSNDLDKLA